MLVFGEGSPVTRLGNFNEQFLDNENLHGFEIFIGGLCGFLGQFCVILHLKFQTKIGNFSWYITKKNPMKVQNVTLMIKVKIITFFRK